MASLGVDFANVCGFLLARRRGRICDRTLIGLSPNAGLVPVDDVVRVRKLVQLPQRLDDFACDEDGIWLCVFLHMACNVYNAVRNCLKGRKVVEVDEPRVHTTSNSEVRLRNLYVAIERFEALDDVLSRLTGILNVSKTRHDAVWCPGCL